MVTNSGCRNKDFAHTEDHIERKAVHGDIDMSLHVTHDHEFHFFRGSKFLSVLLLLVGKAANLTRTAHMTSRYMDFFHTVPNSFSWSEGKMDLHILAVDLTFKSFRRPIGCHQVCPVAHRAPDSRFLET